MITEPVVATTYVAERTAPPAALKDWLVIINPAAGQQHAHHWMAALSQRLQHELDAEVVITRSYAEIAERLGPTCRARGIAVFGGDGTIAEVVNHMNLAEQRLLLLAGGTGNGLARDLGIMSIDHALSAFRANAHVAIDLLQVTLRTPHTQIRRLAVSTSSLGYAAKTVVLAKQLPRLLGAFRYTIASLLQAAHMSACRLSVTIDGAPAREVQLTDLMVNNTRHTGNFSAFRQARLRDGRSDVLLTDNRFWQQVRCNFGLLMQTYAYVRGQELSAKTMHVRATTPLRLMLDGEIWDDVYQVSFAVLPKRLRCYYWRGAPLL